jgi:hypothetical protein
MTRRKTQPIQEEKLIFIVVWVRANSGWRTRGCREDKGRGWIKKHVGQQLKINKKKRKETLGG